MDNDGPVVTVTVADAVLVQVLAAVAVTVYVVVEAGLANTVAPEFVFRPVPGDQA